MGLRPKPRQNSDARDALSRRGRPRIKQATYFWAACFSFFFFCFSLVESLGLLFFLSFSTPLAMVDSFPAEEDIRCLDDFEGLCALFWQVVREDVEAPLVGREDMKSLRQHVRPAADGLEDINLGPWLHHADEPLLFVAPRSDWYFSRRGHDSRLWIERE